MPTRFCLRLQTQVLFAGIAAIHPAHTQPTVRFATPVAATPYEFVRPIAIRELPDGTALIADQSENRLLHYNFATGASTNIGRTGSGPGEYRTVGWLFALGADSSLLTDAYTGRWFVLVGTKITKTFAEQEPANLLLRGRLDGASRDGHVVSTQAHIYAKGARRFPSTADTFVLIRANWRAVAIDTVARLLGPGDADAAQPCVPNQSTCCGRKGIVAPRWMDRGGKTSTVPRRLATTEWSMDSRDCTSHVRTQGDYRARQMLHDSSDGGQVLL